MYRIACIIAAVVILIPAALATTYTATVDDNQTLTSTFSYSLAISNSGNVHPPGTFGWGVHSFDSSDYSFSLAGYNPANMAMISATLDLEKLASSSFTFGWIVTDGTNPVDPGGPWRPFVSGSASSYTFLTISALVSGNNVVLALGPNTPLVAYDMMPVFGADLQANDDIVITWRQTFTETACYDGSCGGTAYAKDDWIGRPSQAPYTLYSGGNMDTYVQATLNWSDALAEVPEPATFLLFGGGLLALGLGGRRFRRN